MSGGFHVHAGIVLPDILRGQRVHAHLCGRAQAGPDVEVDRARGHAGPYDRCAGRVGLETGERTGPVELRFVDHFGHFRLQKLFHAGTGYRDAHSALLWLVSCCLLGRVANTQGTKVGEGPALRAVPAAAGVAPLRGCHHRGHAFLRVPQLGDALFEAVVDRLYGAA